MFFHLSRNSGLFATGVIPTLLIVLAALGLNAWLNHKLRLAIQAQDKPQ